jgi:hypothetical protein
MSETRQSARSATSATTGQPWAATGWAGWIVFAGVLAILVGGFQLIAGLIGLLDTDIPVPVSMAGAERVVVHPGYGAWGWVHLVFGALLLGTGAGLLAGRWWARALGIVFAALSAVASLMFLAAFPVWATLIVAIDVLVIYAIAVHGGELAGHP